MRVINHRQFDRQKKRPAQWPRILVWGGAALVAVIVLLNGVLWAMYRNKVLPNYSVGTAQVGGVAFADITKHVNGENVLPRQLNLQLENTNVSVTPAEAGITTDTAATIQKLKESRPLLPMLSLFTKHVVPVQVKVDATTFNKTVEPLKRLFAKQALGKHIVYQNNTFSIAEPVAGYTLATDRLESVMVANAASGKQSVTVPTNPTTSEITVANIQGELQKLQKQQNASVSFLYSTRTHKPSAGDIGAWFVRDGATMVVSRQAITAYVQKTAKQLGVAPINTDDAVSASIYALTKSQQVNFRLISSQAKVYKYCALQRGLNDSVLPDFKLKLAATYGDTRGWNDNGKIAFIYSDDGCQLHNWLSSASSMTSFGGICDPYYSCTVYPNVITNYDRWNGATDPWNAQHLAIEDYRSMVINHESGHWLGFGHTTCPGTGQPAPVMQQQSVDLGGCTFNPWPVLTELQSLHAAALKPREDGALAGSPCCSCGHCAGAGSQA